MTEFEIDDNYIKKYESHCVGSEIHKELWIPAEKMPEFNENILGRIQIKRAYYGTEYTGISPNGKSGFKEDNINRQLKLLESTLNYNCMDFSGTVYVEWKLINLNFLYWFKVFSEHKEALKSIYNCLEKNDKLYITKELIF
ncbi:hypothetical protein [Holdemania massiliensis]|uniref:hypothetical protein n=1 Tax=Holdemania massiliensis TaxID=1468449 RepID=UPI001F05D520|nr:hypothetical protein [Holdemania massiliensis]MCH1939876.1 hypothetical protein [Holdemania massiliensis]